MRCRANQFPTKTEIFSKYLLNTEIWCCEKQGPRESSTNSFSKIYFRKTETTSLIVGLVNRRNLEVLKVYIKHLEVFNKFGIVILQRKLF